jgi:MtN3 and saliva related transmembrane protein
VGLNNHVCLARIKTLNLSTEIVGFSAGTLTTLCWTPQAIKILRTRDAQSISLVTQIAFVLGCTLWLIYGVLIQSISIIVFNVITVLLNILIIGLKLRYDGALSR